MRYFKNQEVKAGDYIFPIDDPKDRYKVVYVKNRYLVVIEIRKDQLLDGWFPDSADVEESNGLLKKDGRYWQVVSWNKASTNLVLKNE